MSIVCRLPIHSTDQYPPGEQTSFNDIPRIASRRKQPKFFQSRDSPCDIGALEIFRILDDDADKGNRGMRQYCGQDLREVGYASTSRQHLNKNQAYPAQHPVAGIPEL
jgi:hypothetical protein